MSAKESLEGDSFKDSTISKHCERRTSPRPTSLAIASVFGTASILSLLIYTLCSSWHTHELPAPARQYSTYYTAQQDPMKPAYGCGNSSSEAQSAGCVFDTMSFAWTRPPCYDPEITADFFAKNPWVRYYEDDDGTIEADPEKLRLGMYDELMITWRYHLTHCMWMWDKMHRALASNRPLDSYAANMEHTHHCTKQVMLNEAWMNGSTPLDEIDTVIQTKYTTCPEP